MNLRFENINTNNEKCTVLSNEKEIGYFNITIVGDENKEGFLEECTYMKSFINNLPDKFGVIRKIYVEENYRNQGYGRAIIEKVKECLFKEVSLIHLIPHPFFKEPQTMTGLEFHNLRMDLVRMYNKFGFVENQYLSGLKNTEVMHLRPLFYDINN